MNQINEETLALLIPITAIAGGLLVAMIAIIAGSIKSVSKSRHREESRREIAAYVAEGSMTTEDAERIINAGRSESKSCGS